MTDDDTSPTGDTSTDVDTTAYTRARAEQDRRSKVMEEAQRFGPPVGAYRPTCTRAHHGEWVILDDNGEPFALACSVCMATVALPSLDVEPGERLVALPAGWEDYDEE